MTHRGPFQPLLFCDSVIGGWVSHGLTGCPLRWLWPRRDACTGHGTSPAQPLGEPPREPGVGGEPPPARDEPGRGGGSGGDASKPSTRGRRGPFVSASFAVREERPPLMGTRLISREDGGAGTADPGPPEPGWDAPSVPGAGEGDPGFGEGIGPRRVRGTGGKRRGNVPHPTASLTPAPPRTLPAWEPDAGRAGTTPPCPRREPPALPERSG